MPMFPNVSVFVFLYKVGFIYNCGEDSICETDLQLKGRIDLARLETKLFSLMLLGNVPGSFLLC